MQSFLLKNLVIHMTVLTIGYSSILNICLHIFLLYYLTSHQFLWKQAFMVGTTCKHSMRARSLLVRVKQFAVYWNIFMRSRYVPCAGISILPKMSVFDVCVWCFWNLAILFLCVVYFVFPQYAKIYVGFTIHMQYKSINFDAGMVLQIFFVEI